jgi:aspartate kinase
MATVVHKYGGSSLASVGQINSVACHVAQTSRAGHAVVVVVSARGDTTDELLALVGQVCAAPPAREVDQLLGTGECASAALLAIALEALGVRAVSLTGAQAGILASGRHGSGRVEAVLASRIRELLRSGVVVVVAGFQGVNAAGDLVTLGRGGSDTTAVAIAAELNIDVCEIRTDVAGVFTADPRTVAGARLLATVPAGVMAEMAFAGARVLHSGALELATLRGVDIRVADARSSEPGSFVTGRIPDGLERHGS